MAARGANYIGKYNVVLMDKVVAYVQYQLAFGMLKTLQWQCLIPNIHFDDELRLKTNVMIQYLEYDRVQ